ncbi:MAG: protein translocase subunit SecF, partial [Rhodospirillaceae bacterium]
LNFGIDFTGGILIELRTPEAVENIATYRAELNGLGLGDIALTTFGDENRDLVVRVQEQPGGEEANLQALDEVKAVFGDGVDYRRIELVGPKVGDELVEAGIWAVSLALLAIAAYIWFRFEWQYALGGIIALTHDMVATIGLYSILQLDFDLTSVAALLTVAGYSINDTVVVFDRVREELRRYKKLTLGQVVNIAINKTLSRTLLTSITTMLAVACLFLLGGEVLRGFSLTIMWGVIVGTYSTLFVAVPMLVWFDLRRSGDDGDDEDEDNKDDGLLREDTSGFVPSSTADEDEEEDKALAKAALEAGEPDAPRKPKRRKMKGRR